MKASRADKYGSACHHISSSSSRSQGLLSSLRPVSSLFLSITIESALPTGHIPRSPSPCIDTQATHIPRPPPLHIGTQGPAVPSVPVPIPMKTGQRSRILRNAEESRIGLLNATTVSTRTPPKQARQGSVNTDRYSGKKLKKRLEDLERRAASSSASPEQRPAELDRSNSQPREEFSSSSSTESVDHQEYGRRTPEIQNQYLPHHEERGMFSHQYTRQLSTSPPPFSYSTYPAPDTAAYAPYAQHAAYHTLPTTTTPDMPMYTPYLPPLSSAYPTTLPSLVHPMKGDFYAEDEISPFSMSYATMAGIDIPAPHYQDSDAQVKLPTKHYYAH